VLNLGGYDVLAQPFSNQEALWEPAACSLAR
jgi:hypothetical protein